jgi:hypothetical protein
MREEMGRSGARHAQSYSWEEMSGRVLEFYGEAADGSGKAA